MFGKSKRNLMVIFYFTRTNKFMRLKIYYIYHTPIYCIVLKHSHTHIYIYMV